MGGQACILYGGAEKYLTQEEFNEKARDRQYWQPLRRELEQWRHEKA
jgi:hypothetical protein